MEKKNKKVSLIFLIASIGLIVIGLNYYFGFLGFSNPRISPIISIILGILILIFGTKLAKSNQA